MEVLHTASAEAPVPAFGQAGVTWGELSLAGLPKQTDREFIYVDTTPQNVRKIAWIGNPEVDGLPMISEIEVRKAEKFPHWFWLFSSQ